MVNDSQNGSVFLLILVAIAMFAGLSYAVYQGSRAGATSLNQDQAKLAALDIVSYSDAVQKGIQTLRLRGCPETQLSVSDPNEFMWITYVTAATPADGSCAVYKQKGARIAAQKAQAEWFAATGPNDYWAYNSNMAITGIGSASPEMLFVLTNLKKEICVKINNTLSVGTNGADPIATSYLDNLGFTGVFPTSAAFTLNLASLNGKSAFCIQDTDNRYKYIRVVLAR